MDWTGFIWLRSGTSAGCIEYGNESSSTRKGGVSWLADRMFSSQEVLGTFIPVAF